MKRFFSILFVMLIACNANLSREDVETKLKDTMLDYLYKGINYDSSKVKYYVKDIIFYDDNRYNTYDCQFKVQMSVEGKKDTVGIMFAAISKDFKEVKRTY
jgi:hypothetical protein